MSSFPSSYAGVICVEPVLAAAPSPCDDSTLERLLKSFAQQAVLEDAPRQPHRERWVAASRLTRRAEIGALRSVRADLGRLLDDLEREFEELYPRLRAG